MALKMRWWDLGNTDDAENRIAGRIGFLFRKSWEKYELTYQAMVARGYMGSANFNYFNPFKPADYLFISIMTVLFALFIFLNIHYA
jgi:energy-coupling factor transporter transmembrane protein EcfT